MDTMVSSHSAMMHPEPTGHMSHLIDPSDLESLSISPQSLDIDIDQGKSYPIIDSRENFLATDIEAFSRKLKLKSIDTKVRVVAIFGNSGEGKSHTMNNIFFDGEEIFKMSAEQNSCTVGVNCYYKNLFYSHQILCVDTEGLQSVAQNENQQHRMLMKVLAVSDIIIYRTRAQRLTVDMYKFLGTASKIYMKHFAPMLNDEASTLTAKGPDVIIFHETQNTVPLTANLNDSPENVIMSTFANMKLNTDAFKSIQYCGIRTVHLPTDYYQLKDVLRKTLDRMDDDNYRPKRTFRATFETLIRLNEKFSGDINGVQYTLHEQHFTCNMACEACNKRCENTKDHAKDGVEHQNEADCEYVQTLNNKIFLCKRCHLNGNGRRIVKVNHQQVNESAWTGLANYAWSLGGNQIQKLDCPTCGEIYRARWYGNKAPEEICVLEEPVHIWKDRPIKAQGTTHSAQAILDGVSYIAETISNVGSQPTKSISSWLADNLVNPSYWKPNSEIISCKSCRINFERNGLKIHHCRNCGDGFCSNCSNKRHAVPQKGWGIKEVRVCIPCWEELRKNDILHQDISEEEAKAVRVRKYGEVVANCVSSVASALEIPKEMIKESARPDYWSKDCDSPSCVICKQAFGSIDEVDQADIYYREKNSGTESSQGSPVHGLIDKRRHHCRQCGLAVCNKCSMSRKPVPERGWNTNVRVCDDCWSKKES